jgi:hypothetical protein
MAPIFATLMGSPIEHGTHQHACTGCGEPEECGDLGSDERCSRPGAGWVRGRFFCKDCAEDQL